MIKPGIAPPCTSYYTSAEHTRAIVKRLLARYPVEQYSVLRSFASDLVRDLGAARRKHRGVLYPKRQPAKRKPVLAPDAVGKGVLQVLPVSGVQPPSLSSPLGPALRSSLPRGSRHSSND